MNFCVYQNDIKIASRTLTLRGEILIADLSLFTLPDLEQHTQYCRYQFTSFISNKLISSSSKHISIWAFNIFNDFVYSKTIDSPTHTLKILYSDAFEMWFIHSRTFPEKVLKINVIDAAIYHSKFVVKLNWNYEQMQMIKSKSSRVNQFNGKRLPRSFLQIFFIHNFNHAHINTINSNEIKTNI